MNKGLFWGNIVTIYLIPMLFAWFIIVGLTSLDFSYSDNITKVLVYLWPVCSVVLLVVNIINHIMIRKGIGNTQKLVKSYLMIKLLQIPAFIIFFVIASLALFCVGLGALYYIIIFLFVSSVCVITSAILAIAIFRRMRKEGMIEDTVQFSMSIGSFLFYIDIFIALVAYRISKKHKVNELFNQPECR